MKMKELVLLSLLVLTFACQSEAPLIGEGEGVRWYKGNLHTHSLWSDGDDYPEMIMDWYKANGYHFVGLSDHNILQEGEKWRRVPDNPITMGAYEAYLNQYGADWVTTREDSVGLEVQLKKLAEYRGLFEVSDHFLILKSEEITDGFDGKPIHMNVTNVKTLIQPRHGNSLVEVMQNNIDAVLEQREATGQAMFPHINHPNFGWAMTAADMKQLRRERFFEVFNGHPAVHNYGDATRLGTEAIWDEINRHYAELDLPLMLGLATDDSHNYHTFGLEYSNTGRGWVMVAADTLTPASLVEHLEAGDFYATTGVTLERFGVVDDRYIVDVQPEEGVEYEIQFIRWEKGADTSEVVQSAAGTQGVYSLSENDWFVRAKIISNKAKENPYQTGDTEVAWTQPLRYGVEAN
ncbi:MAG TPA: hypothetical protein VJ953_20780 [Saprospiraceae bacterium]|nr:hypothetical protein [Saprospiraceae bacterium]